MTLEEEQKILSDRNRVIQELVYTERNYVQHLGMVADSSGNKSYLALMKDTNCELPLPENWNPSCESNVFCNMESIYNWHKNIFLRELERTLTDPSQLGPVFERNERKMLSMYTKYSHNKKTSLKTTEDFKEYLGNLREKLGHTQQLSELLFKPIQRITVYHLLMERVYESSKKIKGLPETESIRRALKVVKNLPHNINVMMKFRDLMGYNSSDEDNGKLLYHGRLLCTDGDEKIKNNTRRKTVYYKGESFMVYLFEKNILFSVVVGMNQENNEPKCYYRNHIPVNNMTFNQVFGCKDTFTIRSTCQEYPIKTDPQTINGERPKGVRVAYTCRAETSESYEEWIQALQDVLLQQYDFAGALENPKANRGLRT